MTHIRFIEFDGTEHLVSSEMGDSVMEVATDNDIDGILAECGGSAICGTCHVYVDDAWRGRLTQPDEDELDTLQNVSELKPSSRLSCQIVVTEELDGLVVRLPEFQG